MLFCFVLLLLLLFFVVVAYYVLFDYSPRLLRMALMDTGKETCQGECIKRETILEKRYQVRVKFYSYKESSVFLIENFSNKSGY